jgi:hypothetical protein
MGNWIKNYYVRFDKRNKKIKRKKNQNLETENLRQKNQNDAMARCG